jgi:transcription elongation GreA/GreB family factor
VSLGSPVGKALAGARTGDVVHVGLPNGRERSLTVVGVSDGAGHRIAEAA